jgi:predicted nuclease of restriction endonuclease-like (RecB) superfamily
MAKERKGYGRLVASISALLEQARQAAARAVNRLLPPTYWEIGRRIVEHEQGGKARAEYGEALLINLARDLMARYGRGFSKSNIFLMRAFYLGWEIFQTPSGILEARAKCLAPSGISHTGNQLTAPLSAEAFPLSWSQYVRLMSVERPQARAFYEAEAIRGDWSVRQLDRQISTQFYERTAQAKRPFILRASGNKPHPESQIPLDMEIRNPYLLEFLDLKDEYSEAELENALILHLERFLLEMGAGFTFVARQKRIRIGRSWYRIDLLLYHRALRCLMAED